MHDEKIFPDPFHFAPERYLPDAVTGILDPAVADMPGIKVGFGFGPRACKFNVYYFPPLLMVSRPRMSLTV